MTSQANSIALGQSNGHSASAVSVSLSERSAFFSEFMREVRGWLGGKKVAEQLAEIWGCDVRSAGRYLAGDRTPGGNELVALLFHPTIGPQAHAFVMREAERRFSPAEYLRFSEQMAKASVRAWLRDDNEERQS